MLWRVAFVPEMVKSMTGVSTHKGESRWPPYLVTDKPLVRQVRYYPQDKLNDLLCGEAGDDVLHHTSQVDLIDRDERVEVDIGKEAHDELAVHAVRHAAVAR